MAQKDLPKYQRLNDDAATVTPNAPYVSEDFAPEKEVTHIATPPSSPGFEPKPQDKPLTVNLVELTEEDVREACLNYASKDCCYGSNFVKTMVPQIHNGCVFHYRLETLGEKRETSQKFSPYHGQAIDGPENGAPPEPWDLQVNVPNDFKNGVHKVEIPYTAFVKPCNKCRATGYIPCPQCIGSGKRICSWCDGSGKQSAITRCNDCEGSGHKRCKVCNGVGQVKCPRCEGYRRLKWFTMLIVTRTNHKENFITNTYNLPKEKIFSEQGVVLFNEEGLKVSPLPHASDASVNFASSLLIEQHRKGFQYERILKQRHSLRAIPFTKVEYQWKNKVGEFYIYGFKKEVYFDKYPQSCGCVCL